MFLQVRDVKKIYPGHMALTGVTFSARKGTVLGVLGKNGAGKSTLFRILASVTRPTSGSVTIGEHPVGLESRKITAFLPEINPFYEWMRVIEQLEFLSAFYAGWDMDKAKELLQLLGLSESDHIGILSRGQQAKLKIVFAFAWPNELTIMDEPFGNIDPPTRKRILDTIFREYRPGGQTIIVATHIVNEIEEFLDDVLYLEKGKIALSGHADTLREEQGTSLEGIFEEIAK